MPMTTTSGLLPLFVNGRFLVQRQTGVQRFAQEILRSLDELLGKLSQSSFFQRAVIVTPRNVDRPPWLRHFEHVQMGQLGRGYLWEQVDLPRISKSGILLSLCNLGPVVKRRQILVVHDAATKAIPQAFSWSFRLAYSLLLPVLLRRACQLATVSTFSRTELGHWF